MSTAVAEPKSSMTDEVMTLDQQYVMGTYARVPRVFVRGEGARLWDSEGNAYLDFLAGISVCSVGHCHPHVAQAIAKQAATLMHTCNIFHNPLQAKLAEKLCEFTGMEKAFFGNSGAEANECAIKLARKHGKARGGEACHEIISFSGSFHGRTLTTVTATAQPKYQAPFTPLPQGFFYCPFNDFAEFDRLFSANTAAVIIEPIQGESGIHVVDPAFLKHLRKRCDETGALLILDEIQCGMGRTGTFLASDQMGVQGDVVTLAKAIASGVPMGVCLARGSAAITLSAGDHGSTFGGQPLACAAALATLEVLEDENLMHHAQQVGGKFIADLKALQARFSGQITEVRGIGLMVGVSLGQPVARQVMTILMDNGVVTNACGDSVLRFLPPLCATNEDCAEVLEKLGSALREIA
jgi:predicted acetylornithine/succinylornithine family transaminase